MATETQIERILFETQGREQLNQMNRDLEQGEKQLAALRAQLAANPANAAALAAQMRTLAASMADTSMKAKALGRQLEQNSLLMNGWQQRITAAGYMMNDFLSVSGGLDQRLNAIANNLPMLLAGFGNLGLALSGIVPIIAMVIRNFDSIKEYFTGVGDVWGKTVEGMKHRLEELENKKLKVGVDTLEIEGLKVQIKQVQDAIEAVNRLRTLQTQAEVESGRAFKEAVDETLDATGKVLSASEIMKILKPDAIAEVEALSDPLKQARDRLAKEDYENRIRKNEAILAATPDLIPMAPIRKGLEVAIAELRRQQANAIREIGDIRTNISKEGGEAEQFIGKDIAAGEKKGGPEQAAAQARMIARARKAGLDWLAENIEQNSVAARRELQLQERQGENRERMARLEEALWMKDVEREDNAGKVIEDAQRRELQEIEHKGDVKAKAEELSRQATKQNMKGQEAYEFVWRNLYLDLQKRLSAVNVAPTGRVVIEEARKIAEQAPGIARQGQQARNEMDARAAQRHIAEEQKSIKAAGLESWAMGLLADMRQQMEVVGRVSMEGQDLGPMDQNQQIKFVQDMIRWRLMSVEKNKMKRGQPREQQGIDIATAVTMAAAKAVNDEINAAMAQNIALQNMNMGVMGMPMGPIGQGQIQFARQQSRARAAGRARDRAAEAAPEGMRSIAPESPTMAPNPSSPPAPASPMASRSPSPLPPSSPIPQESIGNLVQVVAAGFDQVQRTQGSLSATNAAVSMLESRLKAIERLSFQINRESNTLVRRSAEDQPSALQFGARTA